MTPDLHPATAAPGPDARPTVAVIGASTAVGRAVMGGLAQADVRLVAIDVTAPEMPPGNAEVKLMDARDRLLPLAVDGVDVIVHAAAHEDIAASPDALYGVNVGGTRNILEAAAKAGVSQVVMISSGTVYGAHNDNAVPLGEDAPLRANPGFAYGYQRQLAEEMAGAWAADHPGTVLTIMRPATILAPGIDHAMARLLIGPRLALPAGGRPLWQFTAAADLADAVSMVISQRLGGTFNVASDGWMTTQEMARTLGCRVQWVGQSTYKEVLRLLAPTGLAPAPPESLDYLVHPWVLDVSRLRAHGWRPSYSNAETLATFAESRAGQVAIGTLTFQRSSLRQAGMGFLGLVALTAWRLVRR